MDRLSLQVHAARRARSLARRFYAKGDQFNGRQALIISFRAMQQARDIKTTGYR